MTESCPEDGGLRDELAALFRTYRPSLLLFALRITGHEDDAEDVVQEAFAAVLAASVPLEPRPYVFATVRNLAVTLVRDRPREVPLSFDAAAPKLPEFAHFKHPNLRRYATLAGSGRRLPAIWRRIADGLTYEEIALDLGTTIDAIKALIWRSRRRLRERGVRMPSGMGPGGGGR